jgi:hypothetical protein
MNSNKNTCQLSFITFRVLQVLFWHFFHPRLFAKIIFKNLSNVNAILIAQMVSNEKIENYKKN